MAFGFYHFIQHVVLQFSFTAHDYIKRGLSTIAEFNICNFELKVTSWSQPSILSPGFEPISFQLICVRWRTKKTTQGAYHGIRFFYPRKSERFISIVESKLA